jgi:hypothetical protein
MTRPAGPFAAPPSKKAKTPKRDTPDEAAEKAYVRRRDRGCVGIRLVSDGLVHAGADGWPCGGPLEVDHVRASGGLGIKSPTHRSNMVVLCRWHHRLKTEYGKTWRPLLLAYLERVGEKP